MPCRHIVFEQPLRAEQVLPVVFHEIVLPECLDTLADGTGQLGHVRQHNHGIRPNGPDWPCGFECWDSAQH